MAMRKILMLILCFSVAITQLVAQTRTVTGKVTDEKGKPIARASVVIKGSAVGTTTNDDGLFSLSVPATAKTLVVSSLNFTTQELSIGSKSVLNVSLQSSNENLQEVVVVGYGTQKRKEVTGSLTTVKGAAIAEKPIQSFEAGLAGRAAGVQITVPSGVLNAPPVFRIRGTNSISLSSQPLIVVDGVPSYSGDYSLTSAPANALASINPNDIESIDIAKDAAATAIYGSRASNGVVFITTKKGKNGKPKVTYDGWAGWTSVYGLPSLLNAQQYTDYKNEAMNNARAVNPIAAASSNSAYYNGFKFATATDANGNLIDTRWYDYVYRQGFSTSHNVSLSGGNENTTYYLSGGYTEQQGIVKKNDFKRMNFLLNVDSRVSKMLSVGGKLAFSNEKNLAAVSSGSLATEAYGTAGLGRTVLVNAPNISPYNNDGSYNLGPTYIGPMNNVLSTTAANTQVGFYNPVVLLDKNRENNEIYRVQSNIYAQLKPVNWLTLKTAYGIDYLLSDNDEFYTPIHGPGQGASGEAIAAFRRRKTWIWTNTAQFDYTFLNKHSISLLAGNEQQRYTLLGYGIDRQQMSDPAYTVIQAGFGLNNSTGQALSENYLISNFGRLNYSFDKKYFLSGNIRQDDYSALGVKRGTFWGVSGGWEIAKEKFWGSLKLDKLFSSFKFRGSYGKVGNISGITDFAAFSTYASGLYGGSATLAFNSAGNPAITWETSKKVDVGVNFGLFKDRVTIEANYYKNNIDGLILNVPQSPSVGLPTSVTANSGTMYNKGLELTINATPIQTKDFSWTSSFNITFNKNEVTALAPGLVEVITPTGTTATGENVNRTAPGYSVGYLWVVKTGGVDPATGRRIFYNKAGRKVFYQHVVPNGTANWTYDDGSTAPAITQAADAVMYQNTSPKQYGGWDNTFHYKNFDLNVLLTYQLGFYVSYGTNAGLHDQRYWNNVTEVLRRWQKPGDVTDMVRPLYGDNVSYGNTIPLDINMFKGDFIKLRNLSLSYNLPRNVLDKVKISNARVYVSGQNLAMFTKYPGPDPEVSSNGTSSSGQGSDRNTVANARTITVGINIGF